MPKVCVDIDGTVLDFHEGLRIRLAELGHTFIPENCVDYGFNGNIGCDKSIIFDLFTDEELYHRLPFLKDAKDAVKLLLEECDAVYGYTASVKHEAIFREREAFVKELGMIPDVYVERKPVIVDADALFDDCLGVHRCWANANSNAKLYLINQYHNQMTEENRDDPIWKRVIRCDSLMDAVKKYLNKE